MAVYIVTGKLGNGKTLVSVGRILDKLKTGCIVATNLDLKLDKLLSVNNKSARVIRIPDKPTIEDLNALGVGNATYDETQNGLLVLDECGTWFNSRNWQDKSRKAVNDWFLHSRKLGWDVMLIVQDIDIIDSQARAAIAEHTCFCRRLDRLHIPFFGTFLKIFTLGEPIRLPRIHVGKVVYGTTELDPLTDRWVYRGTGLFAAYDTKQLFLDDYAHGVHSMLPGWYTKGRYAVPQDWKFIMRMTKIMWKRFKAPFALAAGIVAGAALASSVAYAAITHQAKQASTPVAAIDNKKPDEKKSDSKSDEPPPMTAAQRVLKELSDLRIVGFLKGKNDEGEEKLFYQFSRAKRGQVPTAIINSEELVHSGVGVKFLSDCRALLTYQDAQAEVFCL